MGIFNGPYYPRCRALSRGIFDRFVAETLPVCLELLKSTRHGPRGWRISGAGCPCTLDNTLFNRLSDQQQIVADGYRYILRATMVWVQGTSIDVEGNNSTRAAASIIAYFSSDWIVKVSIDSCPWHRYSLEIILNRLSYEQYLWIAIYRYVLIHAIGFQWYRSKRNGQFSRLATLSIDTYYCSMIYFCKGVDRHLFPN